MQDRREAVEVLRGSPIFSLFTAPELDALVAGSDRAAYVAGDVVFSEGEPGIEFFVVLSGTIRVSHITQEGLEQPIVAFRPGACVGEMSFLDGGRRSATAVATRDSELIRVNEACLGAVERQFPEVRAKLLARGLNLLSTRLRASNESYWDLARRSANSQMEIEQTRSRLLSLVSHELRTPLTIIKSSAQVLKRITVEEGADFVEKILRQADHLHLMIDDLITLALLRDQYQIEETVEFDGEALLLEVVEELSGAAGHKGMEIIVSRRKRPTRVFGDRPLLKKAVRHLVDNAVKFAPRESSVHLKVSLRNREARISVLDEGRGVSEDALANLRQSFVQSQDPLNRDVEGLGIGLSLAYDVINAHGGKLLVDSSGRGCRFTLAWPNRRRALIAGAAEERSIQNV